MQGETIICVATANWHSLWRPVQQIISRIARQNRVYYFEPGRNPERSLSSELWNNAPHFVRFEAEQIHENLIRIPTPSSLPYARQHLPSALLQVTTPLVADVNARILHGHIRRAIQKLDIKNPILWLYEPRHLNLVGKFGEKLTVYFNYDEMAAFAPNKHIRQLLELYDDRLSSRADVIIATSRSQAQRRKKINPNTYFVPNAVDFDLFNQAVDPQTPIPADIAALNKPIIGLVGWLGFQVDLPLLIHVARSFPDHSLALVGPDNLPDNQHSSTLRSLPNVHFLGQKALEELPGYLKAIDVALIPYVLEGYPLTAYPLKLHEYLAAGKPVVATAMPELRYFADTVSIGENPDQFVNMIRAAFNTRTADAIASRIAVAQENTWEQRVLEIYRVLEPYLAAANERRQPYVHEHEVVGATG
jgi:glycosyltransferase involved in cell wall biosynthesis